MTHLGLCQRNEFMVCSGFICVGSSGPTETGADRKKIHQGGWWKKWGSPHSVFVNKVSPPAVLVPWLDFSTVARRCSTKIQQVNCGDLILTVHPFYPKKLHLCANLFCHRKCFCCLDYIHWQCFLFSCDILILTRSHGKEVHTKDFCINQGLRPTCC